MYIDLTWKIGLPALIGLFALAIVAMNSTTSVARTGTESRGVTRSAPTSSVCNILYPIPCDYVRPW
jgi:hypothetical protein